MLPTLRFHEVLQHYGRHHLFAKKQTKTEKHLRHADTRTCNTSTAYVTLSLTPL